jgi:hypothetical protein
MSRFRFTIRGIVWLVVFLGVAIAALRESNDAWDCGVFGLTLLILLTAVLLAIHRRESHRAFWLGFVLFGGVYLLLSLMPPIESRLPTTKLLAFLEAKVPGRDRTFSVVFTTSSPSNGFTVGSGGSVNSGTFILNTPPTAANPAPAPAPATNPAGDWVIDTTNLTRIFASPTATTENFVRIGHSLTALLLALVGASLSRWIHGGRLVPAVTAPVMERSNTPPDRSSGGTLETPDGR